MYNDFTTTPEKKQEGNGRPPQPNLRLLTGEDIACIDGAQARLRDALRNAVNESGMKQGEFAESFYPYISSPSRLSDFLAGKRPIPFDLAIALCRVCKIDLIAIANGDAQPRPENLKRELLKWAIDELKRNT